jgi:transcriptional regulator with XRE-family HTH domain
MPKQPNPIDVHVGQRVRLRRMILGVSQEKVGDSLGITFQQVQKYEKGTNRISASRLQQIANILSVPVPYFFEDQPSDQMGSSGKDADHHHGTEFLSDPQAFRLNSAFARIKDAKVRRAVIDLVRALGDGQEGNGRHTPSSPTPDPEGDHSS